MPSREKRVVYLLRHAETDWSKERVRKIRRRQLPPVRTPDKQDPGLSPFGRVQAYLVGIFIKSLLANENGRARCDFVAYSKFARTEQTAQWAMRAAGFDPRHREVSADLNEQSHSHAVSPEAFSAIQACLQSSGDPAGLEIAQTLVKVLGSAALPYPLPNTRRITPAQGLQMGLLVNLTDLMRNAYERYGVNRLNGEEKQRAKRLAFSSCVRSMARSYGP